MKQKKLTSVIAGLSLIILLGLIPEYSNAQKATKMFEKGEYDKAEEYCVKQYGEKQNECYIELAEAYSGKGDNEKATEFYVKIADKYFEKEEYQKASIWYAKANLIEKEKECIAKITLIDSRDEKKYKTIKIGNQWWMAENLAFKTDSGCWIYDNDTNNLKTYGYLYNWEAAKAACPSGWHLPTEIELKNLVNYLDGEKVAGGKLKSTSSLWNSPNTSATNSSGFSALPAGYRRVHSIQVSSIGDRGKSTYFWTSTMYDFQNAKACRLYNDFSKIGIFYYKHTYGFSVRCIKN